MATIHYGVKKKDLAYQHESINIACGFWGIVVRSIFPKTDPRGDVALQPQNATCGRCKRTKIYKQALKQAEAI